MIVNQSPETLVILVIVVVVPLAVTVSPGLKKFILVVLSSVNTEAIDQVLTKIAPDPLAL